MGFMDRLKEMFGGGGASSREPVETGDAGPSPAQSAAVDETPEEQRQAAAEDPAATSEPGTEGQDQEPR
jgi:hypothetical protein